MADALKNESLTTVEKSMAALQNLLECILICYSSPMMIWLIRQLTIKHILKKKTESLPVD